MIALGQQEHIEEYFSSDDVSQSFLKLLLKSVTLIDVKEEKELYYEEKGHLIIGSAVDCILTQGREEYNRQYYKFRGEKPSDTIMSIVKEVYDTFNFEELDTPPSLRELRSHILESVNNHGYQTNWKEDTRINKVIESGSDYFIELQESDGKQIVDDIEENIINNIVMSFTTHEFTSEYFKDIDKAGNKIDIYYQVPIYFEIEGVPCKVLIDQLRINHKTKEIFPLDFKTMSGSTLDFMKSYRKLRYDIQGSFYTKGLLEYVNRNATSPLLKGDLTGYTIKPFQFMVETTDFSKTKVGEIYKQGNPLIYTMSNKAIMQGKEGRPRLSVPGYGENGMLLMDIPIIYEEIAGWKKAIELYQWHMEVGFDYDQQVLSNKGNILIE